MIEINLILNILRQSINELTEEQFLQERRGIAKAVLDFIDTLEFKVNEDQQTSASAISSDTSNTIMETLLDDYTRRLKAINETIVLRRSQSDLNSDYIRLRTKASYYRDILSELERALANSH